MQPSDPAAHTDGVDFRWRVLAVLMGDVVGPIVAALPRLAAGRAARRLRS